MFDFIYLILSIYFHLFNLLYLILYVWFYVYILILFIYNNMFFLCLIYIYILIAASFNNVNNIETLVKEIQLSVQSIIQEAVFMIRESEHVQFFWSFKYSEIVATIKRRSREWSFLQIEKNWKTYLKFIDVKKKNHRQEKEIEIQKNLWKVYNSDDFILTSRSLSENTDTQIEENFQSFELNSEEQFWKNNTNS
jgi:hypothetical protein